MLTYRIQKPSIVVLTHIVVIASDADEMKWPYLGCADSGCQFVCSTTKLTTLPNTDHISAGETVGRFEMKSKNPSLVRVIRLTERYFGARVE